MWNADDTALYTYTNINKILIQKCQKQNPAHSVY